MKLLNSLLAVLAGAAIATTATPASAEIAPITQTATTKSKKLCVAKICVTLPKSIQETSEDDRAFGFPGKSYWSYDATAQYNFEVIDKPKDQSLRQLKQFVVGMTNYYCNVKWYKGKKVSWTRPANRTDSPFYRGVKKRTTVIQCVNYTIGDTEVPAQWTISRSYIFIANNRVYVISSFVIQNANKPKLKLPVSASKYLASTHKKK